MGWMPAFSGGVEMCQFLWGKSHATERRHPWKRLKNVFQLHGAAADGSAVFRKKLSRHQFHTFMAAQPACIVAMEACGSAHYWAREMARLGHEPKLIAPRYVRPFVKRQKKE
jgi:transposase